MASNLREWENRFSRELNRSGVEWHKAGSLLLAIPNRADWERFLAVVRHEWSSWSNDFSRWPSCLVLLYGSLAFYEYEENRFWPHLSFLVQQDIPGSRQSEMNHAFSRSAQPIGLRVLHRTERGDYVGSAIYHIGVPLSLWDGFLVVCEWALLQDDWSELSEADWKEAMTKRAGGRIRLRNFLIDNREAATAFIQEMLDARQLLSEDQSLKIGDLKQASLLRVEYFEEVPETAEFLRWSNPESLFGDRARLLWDEQRAEIRVDLPPVARNKLPAMGTVGEMNQNASSTSDAIQLNGGAFVSSLLLFLDSGLQSESQRIRGLEPFGLFDEERNRFCNPEREELPTSRYALIARSKLLDISRKGFSEEERENESYELIDGMKCYLTKLWPTSNAAELAFTLSDKRFKLRFRQAARIETRVFAGDASMAANFIRTGTGITLERLPLICVSVPSDYFKDTLAVLDRKFEVVIDDPQTYVSYGSWEKHHEDPDREFYFWHWAATPVRSKREARTFRSFAEMNPCDFQPPALEGVRKVVISAPHLQLRFEHDIELVNSFPGMDACWKKLPGKYLLWFLLCQDPGGMRLDDLLVASAMVARSERVTALSLYRLLCRYARFGFVVRQGQKWRISESRARIKASVPELFEVQFCGDPSLLWGLYRNVLRSNRRVQRQLEVPLPRRVAITPQQRPLPIIEVLDERRHPPYLRMLWKKNFENLIRHYLEQRGVHFVSDLWRP